MFSGTYTCLGVKRSSEVFRKGLKGLSIGAYRSPEVARKVQECQEESREIQRCSVVS